MNASVFCNNECHFECYNTWQYYKFSSCLQIYRALCCVFCKVICVPCIHKNIKSKSTSYSVCRQDRDYCPSSVHSTSLNWNKIVPKSFGCFIYIPHCFIIQTDCWYSVQDLQKWLDILSALIFWGPTWDTWRDLILRSLELNIFWKSRPYKGSQIGPPNHFWKFRPVYSMWH